LKTITRISWIKTNIFLLFYSVTTYVTEDGQTGQIIISGNSTYQQEITSSSNGVVSLGDTNISTITSPDGSVLSLGEDAIDQLAGNFLLKTMRRKSQFGNFKMLRSSITSYFFNFSGLENFPPGAIQVATTQNPDGTTHLQYILNEDPNIQGEESNSVMANSRKLYQCDYQKCKKQFNSPYKLKAHNRTHAGILYKGSIDIHNIDQ
jgi:hypothetical protein